MNKYRNIKSDGFDSQKERKRYLDLILMEKAGEIRDLKRQVKFELLPKMKGRYRTERSVNYIADFTYYRVNPMGSDEYVVEDVKSEITRKKPDYVIKRKLMLYRKGISVYEYVTERKKK